MSSLEELLKKYKETVSLGSIDRVKTRFLIGPPSLNLAIGDWNGVESGNIVQLVGKFSSGKSTLALDIIAQHQRAMGLPVIYADFERAYDRRYAEAIGVNTDLIHIVRADSTEEGFSFVEKAIKTEGAKLVVIDSIAAAKPSSENEKDYTDSQKMGGNSPISGRFINRIVPLIDNHDVLLVVLNQLRANFNTMSPERDVPAGGKALHYGTSIMIQLTNIKNTENDTRIQAVIKKNRVGPPRQVTEFTINYGKGIDHTLNIMELAIEKDIVTKAGSWISYNGKKVQGLERACNEFPIDEIKELVRKTYNDD
jgi:recombination protein RecA